MPSIPETFRRGALQAWARTPEGVRTAVRRTSAFSPLRTRLWPQGSNLVRFVKVTDAFEPGPPRVLILDLDIPQPTRSGGHRRLLEIARILDSAGVQVTIGTCNPLERTAVAWGVPITNLRREAAQLRSRFPVIAGPREIEDFLNRQGRDLAAVWFSRTGPGLLYLHLVLAAAPRAKIVFDSMDAEHVRLARRAKVDGLGDEQSDLLDVLRRERLMVQTADSIIAVSKSDATALSALADGAPGIVTVIPNLYDIGAIQSHSVIRKSQWDLLFVGGFLHEPNRDAVLWFLEGIMPRLRSHRYRIALVGHGLPAHLARMAGELGVSYLGEVASLDSLYASTRVSIAPVRFGSGVKGKVIEAALHGVPVVGTTVAWEGIGVLDGISGLVADDEDTFASAVEILMASDQKRSDIVLRSEEWIRYFSAEVYTHLLCDIVGVNRG